MKISKLDLISFDTQTHSILENNNAYKPATINADDEFKIFGKKIEGERAEFTKSDLDKQIQDAYAKGLNEGKTIGVNEVTKTVLSVEQASEQGIQKILAEMTISLQDFEAKKLAHKQDMAKLTYHIIKRIIGNKVEENFEEIMLNAFEKIMPIVSKEPKLVIKMNTDVLTNIQTKAEQLIKKSGFAGEIEFIGNAHFATEVCKVEWGNTGINFDLEDQINEIDEIINEYIKSV